MSVNLSPVAGAAAQFLDNSGNVLTGGKLYTYLAGTTTPAATYTSSTGATFHSNPIILDAAGRVPAGGEIWLSDNVQYKFVLKDANDVLLGTWDNLVGINSNFVNYNTQEEIQVATAGQTVFTLNTVSYTPGTNTLSVFVDGVNQYDGITYAYVETDATTVTFTAGLHVGALVKFTTAVTLSAGVTDSSLVVYNPPFTASVPTTVELKLAQTVSVKDFGAVGDGVTDDTAAFADAIAASKQVYIPIGTYLISSLIFNTSGLSGIKFTGASTTETILKAAASATNLLSVYGNYNQYNTFENFTVDMALMPNSTASKGLYFKQTWGNSIRNVNVINTGASAYPCYLDVGTYTSVFDNCDFGSTTGVVKLQGISLSDAVTTVTFIGCSFGSMVADNATSITLLQPIVQGALDKFVLSNILGFSILNGDIEGTGVYLNFGSSVGHFSSSNNSLIGFTGTYTSGSFNGGYLMDLFGVTPFTLSPVDGTIHNGAITEQNSSTSGFRKTIQNTDATPRTVDIKFGSGPSNASYVGINASGDSYIDNRGSGKVVLQTTGTDKLGISASNQLIIGTVTSSGATAGSNGAPPAQVAGYFTVVSGAATIKIPYYNN